MKQVQAESTATCTVNALHDDMITKIVWPELHYDPKTRRLQGHPHGKQGIGTLKG